MDTISPEAKERILNESLFRSKIDRNRKIILRLVILVVVLFVVAVSSFAWEYTKVNNQAVVATTLAQDLKSVCEVPNPNRTAAARALCIRANAVVNDAPASTKSSSGPVGPIGPAGPQGPPGFPGLTGAVGLAGTNGKNGSNGTSGSNGAAGSNGTAGKNGVNGVDGKNGVAGKDGVPGPPGPKGDPGATGPTGPAGAPGATGANGRGVTSVNCGSDGVFTVTYTDGTTQPVSGSHCNGLP